MIGVLLRVAGLATIYLLVLTSVAPADIVLGVLLGAVFVLASRGRGARQQPAAWGRWLVGVARMIVLTAWDIAVGTVRVIRFCLGRGGSPGFVEIPRGERSRHGVALWGVLTGEAPDEYPVAVDDERGILIVHNVDARDPDGIRARHATARAGYQQDVVP